MVEMDKEKKRTEKKVCQCCSCEHIFIEADLDDGSCPHCLSGNWVRGYIDEPEPKEVSNNIS